MYCLQILCSLTGFLIQMLMCILHEYFTQLSKQTWNFSMERLMITTDYKRSTLKVRIWLTAISNSTNYGFPALGKGRNILFVGLWCTVLSRISQQTWSELAFKFNMSCFCHMLTERRLDTKTSTGKKIEAEWTSEPTFETIINCFLSINSVIIVKYVQFCVREFSSKENKH